MLASRGPALQITSIVPILTVDDLHKSVGFYEAIGFTIDDRWEEGGELLGVMMRAGNTLIGLNQDDWKKGRDRKKGLGMRWFMTASQDIDDIAARARGAGITLDSEPHDTEFGSRAFEVTDPSGFLLTIASEAPA